VCVIIFLFYYCEALSNILIFKKEYKLKVDPVHEKLRGYKSNCPRHSTRINNNKKMPENAGLKTKWTKTTGKTFEETIRRSRNWSINA